MLVPVVSLYDLKVLETVLNADLVRRASLDRNQPGQDYLGGISSNSGSELALVYQAGLEPQKMFCVGLMPGSSSSVPAGMITTLPLFDSHGNEEPQFLQKQVAKYFVSTGSYLPTNSSPLIQLKSSGDANRLAACALPVNFRQREQWQY